MTEEQDDILDDVEEITDAETDDNETDATDLDEAADDLDEAADLSTEKRIGVDEVTKALESAEGVTNHKGVVVKNTDQTHVQLRDIVLPELAIVEQYLQGSKESIRRVLGDMVMRQLAARAEGDKITEGSIGRQMMLIAAQQKVAAVNVSWDFVYGLSARMINLLLLKM